MEAGRSLNERTFWITFSYSTDPKRFKHDIFRYTTITIKVNNEEFFNKSKTEQKEFLIEEAKNYLISWYVRHKYKQRKKEANLTFEDGSLTIVYKGFKVGKPFEINGINNDLEDN